MKMIGDDTRKLKSQLKLYEKKAPITKNLLKSPKKATFKYFQ